MNPLSPESNDDARLAAWMKRHASTAPLPDDGFSDRVLTALPPRRRAFPWRHVSVGVVGALCGALAMRFDLGEWPTLAGAIGPLTEALRKAAMYFSDPWLTAALAGAVMISVALAAIVFAFRDDESAEA